MFLLKISLFFLLLGAPLLAETPPPSLINADKATYVELLKTIKESKVVNDEISLQKVLLDKLINALPPIVLPTLSSPENSDEYSTLFNRYMEDALKKDSLVKKTKSITTKIKTLEKEIKSLEKNNPSERTLQLQNALYSKSLQENKEHNEAISNEMLAIEKMLIESLAKLTFNSEELNKNTLSNQEEAIKLRATIDNFLVKKERFELLGDTRDRGVSTAVIQAKEESYSKAFKASLSSLFLEFADATKSKNEKAFALEKSILTEVSTLENATILKESLASLLRMMKKHYFGTLDAITGSTEQEIKYIFKLSWSMVTEPIFTLNGTPITIFKLILAVLIFIIGFILGGFYKASIRRISSTSKSINLATRTILANLGSYAIILTSFFIALNVVGIDLSSIALVAGALSVGIGFGLQNIVSNFISGIILIFERSIKIGDFVELSDTMRGNITDIRMRSTTLNTNGNIDVIVPNLNFIQNNVINWTMHDKIKRFDVPFGVAYGTKPEHVIEVLLEAVEKSGFPDILTTPERFTQVLMLSMGASSVDFSLQVWIHGEEILAPRKTMSRFLILVYNTLYEHGIEIPFPQQDIHIKNLDKISDVAVLSSKN